MEISGINNGNNKFSFQVSADKHKNFKNVHFQGNKSIRNRPIKPVSVPIAFQQNIKLDASNQFGMQNAISQRAQSTGGNISEFMFEGKPVSGMANDKAREMLREDGFFGAKKTGHRIASSAIGVSGDDVERLKLARDATIQGFKEAEAAFGGQLFQASHDTLDVALKEIDEKIHELNGLVIDVEA